MMFFLVRNILEDPVELPFAKTDHPETALPLEGFRVVQLC